MCVYLYIHDHTVNSVGVHVTCSPKSMIRLSAQSMGRAGGSLLEPFAPGGAFVERGTLVEKRQLRAGRVQGTRISFC